jgi:hypothetical protein
VNESEDMRLHAYPNPAQSELTLVWPESNGIARVMDVAGREVSRDVLNQPHSTWNTSGWAEGTYLVAWQGASGSQLVTRVSIVR